MKFKQILIAVDQLANTFVYAKEDESFGYADETLSARCWRLQHQSKFWRTGRHIVDAIFFMEKDHCYKSWIAEFERKQYPDIYTELTPEEAEEYSRTK